MNYRAIIKEVTDSNTAPALTVSLRDIIDEIEKRTGKTPSTNTVSYILREMGFATKDKGKKVWIRMSNDN